MPKTICITVLFIVAVAFGTLVPASEVGAVEGVCHEGDNTDDFECNDGSVPEGPHFTIRTGQPVAEVKPCEPAFGGDPTKTCTRYEWNVYPAGSHFDVIVHRSFAPLLRDHSPLLLFETGVNCTGDGDGSQGGSRFARFLQANCVILFDGVGPHHAEFEGDLTSEPTDWYEKKASDNFPLNLPGTVSDDNFQGDWGITRGPAFKGGIVRAANQPVVAEPRLQIGDRLLCFSTDANLCPVAPVFCADDPLCADGTIPSDPDPNVDTCPIKSDQPSSDVEVIIDGEVHHFVDGNVFDDAGVCPKVFAVATLGSKCTWVNLFGSMVKICQ